MPTKHFLNSILFLCFTSQLYAEVYTAQGNFVGEVTSTTALVQTRLTSLPGPELDVNADLPGAEGAVRFEFGESADLSHSKFTEWMKTEATKDYIVRAELSGLKPNTRYFYRVRFGDSQANTRTGELCHFKTLPGNNSDADVSFCVGSCMNYNKFMYGKSGKASGPLTATQEDKQLGFPAFAAMNQLEPDFFIGTGDIVYYDNVLNGPATSLEELRQCWHQQFRFPRLIEFFGKTPAYWSKDDHDFRFNDSDLSSSKLPLPKTGIEVFREQLPIHAEGDNSSPTYRTHRVNKDLQIWLTEGRDYRSPNRMEDGPDKSLWGQEQRDWLKQTLLESDAKWKILVSPTPMVGPDDAYKKDNHTNLGGFRYEADQFFAWMLENKIEGFMTICGDRHWQYHSIHPSGIEEFACGALNDENARPGVAPGSPKGTDPDGLIKQPYTYESPTGGFLHLKLRSQKASELTIEFRDDTGKLLHVVDKK